MSESVEIVDGQLEAFRARNVEEFLSYYSDDTAVVLFDGTPMYADKEAMRAAYATLFANSPDLGVVIASRITTGEFVVDEEHLSGFHFDGMPTEMVATTVYRVTGGKIARLMFLM
jgi:hypothetical protein